MPTGVHHGVAHLSRRCIVCQRHYQPYQDTQRFCSALCRNRWHHEKRGLVVLEKIMTHGSITAYWEVLDRRREEREEARRLEFGESREGPPVKPEAPMDGQSGR